MDQTQWYIWAALPAIVILSSAARAAYGLYLLELVQTVLVTEIAWADLCAGWGIPSALLRIDWGFSMAPLASGLSK